MRREQAAAIAWGASLLAGLALLGLTAAVGVITLAYHAGRLL